MNKHTLVAPLALTMACMWLLVGAFFISFGLIAGNAQEKINLSTPETTPTNTGYRLQRVTLSFDDPATPSVDEGLLEMLFSGVERSDASIRCAYTANTTPTGTFLMTALQKSRLDQAYAANATTGSLKQRIHHRLVVMGEAAAVCSRSLTGSLAGTVP